MSLRIAAAPPLARPARLARPAQLAALALLASALCFGGAALGEGQAPEVDDAATPVESGLASPTEAAPETDSLDARIAALEAEIQRHQERLRKLVGTAPGELSADPELLEISGALPPLQRTLKTLRAERDANALRRARPDPP